MRNAPSLLALKLMHLMIGTAGGRMADDVRHEIRLSDIRKIHGMKNHDRASLTPLFEELRAVVIREGDPTDDAQRVIVGGLLDHAVLDRKDPISGDTLLSWFFGRMFRDMAEKSNHWAILDRQAVFHLSSKYAVLLFQHIASLVNLDRMNAKTFTVPELRALFGVADVKHKRFAELNRWAIKPSIDEINHLSRLTLTATPNKSGRSVVSVTIGWRVKGDPSAARREMAGSRVGREARRNGTAEMVAVAFPAAGGITYSPHWLELKRAAGCNKDNDLIASDFRRFCAQRDIPLDARNIEATFSNFCAKVGRV
ncbi:replication initiation protein [Paracoccus albus]|uniref:replication initiation protein n=1 Tax=Paracoccus albus TaxID=3017784 RepID=UPI0022F06F82|nr:replication initiation protein [Paracoccus albus]WBU62395.1 replication initiation protein [Paracoccus albus]